MTAERSPIHDQRRTSGTTVPTAAGQAAARYGDERDRAVLELPRAYNLSRDRVRWGPIWAGLVTALTTMLLPASSAWPSG